MASRFHKHLYSHLYSRGARCVIRAALWSAVIIILYIIKNSFPHSSSSQWSAEDHELHSPRFCSLDPKGRSYSVGGEKAFPIKENHYGFEKPWAFLKDKGTFHLQGHKGFYDRNHQLLQLFGNVSVSSPDDYYLHTPKAWMNFQTKNVKGQDPVWGKGPLGSFHARGFSLRKGHLKLQGPVSMTVKSNSALNIFGPSSTPTAMPKKRHYTSHRR